MVSLSFQRDVRWFDVEIKLRMLTLTEAANFQTTVDESRVKMLQKEAQELFETAKSQWETTHNRQNGFLSQKTTKDRLALATQSLQDPSSAFAVKDNLSEIVKLLATKSTQHHGFICGTIKEILTSDIVLPRSRRLKSFLQQPLHTLPSTSGPDRDRALFFWHYEDLVKKCFGELLSILEAELRVTQIVETRRLNVLRLLGDLLHALPEEQNRMCAIVVNKLGDPNPAISTRCAAILLEFMQRHSAVQRVVVTELETLLFRTNVDIRTQTLAIHVLNQVVFNHQDPKLPSKCIATYFSLFKHFIAVAEVERRVMNGVMIGIKRAVPYVAKFEDLETHFDTLFTMASASRSFHHRVAALNLLQIVIEHNVSSANVTPILPRFYRSLYHLVAFDPVHLPYSAHLTLYFSLLYKSLRRVHDMAILSAFVKRLLQTSLTNSPAYACAALMLLGELCKTNPYLRGYLGKKAPGGKEVVTTASSHKKVTPAGKQEVGAYDTQSRDPQYCNASQECTWELRRLTQHFHPTVVKFATLLLLGTEIDHTGHPLDDFTVLHFCELFMTKKPQKRMREMMSLHQRKPQKENEKVLLGTQSIQLEGLFVKKYEMQLPERPIEQPSKGVEPSEDDEDDDDDDDEPEEKDEKEGSDGEDEDTDIPPEIRALFKYKSYKKLDSVLQREMQREEGADKKGGKGPEDPELYDEENAIYDEEEAKGDTAPVAKRRKKTKLK